MELPRRFGRYILEERLGQGGMAEVFRARIDEGGFQKQVCIKRMLKGLSERQDFANMFRDEASLAARLQHPNLVQALDFGSADGTLYLVLELVDGVSLARVLRAMHVAGERIPVTNALMIAMNIARGLHAAHRATAVDGRPLHIIHRDVTPSNVLLSAIGEVKVIDFGVAHAAERITHTATGIVKGKPAYFTPEQALGDPLDHRVDQFQTGIVLWEILAGKQLFKRKKEMQTLEAVIACEVPSLKTIRDDVPPAVDDLVRRALQRDPKARYLDMAVFEAAIAAELYPRVKRPGHLDLRALVERTRDLEGEGDETARIARARPQLDVEPSAEIASAPTVSPVPTPSGSAEVTRKTAASPSSMTGSLEMDVTAANAASPSSGDNTAVVSATSLRTSRLSLAVALGAGAGAIATLIIVAATAPAEKSAEKPAGERAPAAAIVRTSEVPPEQRPDVQKPLGAAAPLVVDETDSPAVPTSAPSARPPSAQPPSAQPPSAQPPSEQPPSEQRPSEQRASDPPSEQPSSGDIDEQAHKTRSPAAYVAARVAQGKKLAMQGRFKEAAAALEDAIVIDARNADAHRTLGVCYAKLGDRQRAARNYAKYLLLRPDAPDAAEVRKALQGNMP